MKVIGCLCPFNVFRYLEREKRDFYEGYAKTQINVNVPAYLFVC